MSTNLSHQELQHYTNLWCKQQGFKNRELNDDKTADNLVLLIIVKQEHWNYMDKHDKAVWNGLHGMLLRGYPFKEKHLKSIESIINQATKAHTKDLIIKAEIKQKVRHLRTLDANKNS